MKKRASKGNSSATEIPAQPATAAFAKDDLIALPLVIGLAALLLMPVFVYSLPNGDDMAQHYWWSREFFNAMKEGVWYPRWLGGAYEGRGSPVMFFYPPLPFFVTSLFQAMGAAPLKALAFSCWLGLAISGLAMYWFSRSLLSRNASLIASVVYMAIHYHLFDLYHRSALNEFWAFAWVPFVLGATHRALSLSGWRIISGLAITYCFLIVTHLPTAFLTTLILPVYAIVQTRDWRKLGKAACGFIMGAGAAGIYILPVLFETDYLRSVRSLSRPKYDAGFLLEDIGTAFDLIPFPSSGDYKTFILAGNWIAVGMFLLIGVGAFLIWKKRRASYLWQNTLLRAVLIITAISALMTTRLTLPLWLIIPRLGVIQFPIRWFAVTSVGASVLVVAATLVISRRSKEFMTDLLTLSLIIIVNLAITVTVVARGPFDKESLNKRLVNYTDVQEYHPRWWDQQRHEELDKAPVVVDRGEATIQALDETGINQAYTVKAESESVLRFRTLYYVGWEARVDGQLAAIRPSVGGHIQMVVEPGEHSLTLKLEDTPPQTAGRIISAISLLLIISAFIVAHIGRRKVSTEPDAISESRAAASELSAVKQWRKRNAKKQTEN